MADEVAKQEIAVTRGTVEFVGVITNFDKQQDYEGKTKKGNGMRSMVFTIDTAEGHSHRLQLRAYQGEDVYFSKTEVDKNGNRKNDIKKVKWNDRQKFNLEGYAPIDRVNYHYGTETDDNGKERRKNVGVLTYDAIPQILEEFNVGDSVRVVATLQIEDYTTNNGDTRTAVRLIPTRIFHTSEEVDFTKEDYKEVANFQQRLLIDEIEKTGTDEITLTGLIIGNQRMGRQDFIFRGESFKTYGNLLKIMKSKQKYVAITLKGILNNGATSEPTVEYVEVMGCKIPMESSRPVANSFIREFLVTAIVTEDKDAPSEGEYTEENVQKFIDTFIRAEKEFGEKTDDKVEDDASDFVF